MSVNYITKKNPPPLTFWGAKSHRLIPPALTFGAEAPLVRSRTSRFGEEPLAQRGGE